MTKSRYLLMAGIALAGAWGTVAQAQDAAAPAAADNGAVAGDEIVVTAQKRVERLIDAPQTVNVVSGDAIEKFNVTRFEDVSKLVPGLEISRGDGRQQAVSLRGVTFDPDSQTTRTVDIYLNEVPFDPTQALQAQFDIGSIQVLRGPQGTLRAGTGPSGAILIGTRQPDLTEVRANGLASYTDREAVNLQAGVSVPIIKDKLAIRVAGLYDLSFGNGVRDIVNGTSDRARSYAGRVSVLFKPTDNLSFLLMHQEYRSKITGLWPVVSVAGLPVGAYGPIAPGDRKAVTLGGNDFATNGSATILNATWDVGEHRVSYLGSYQDNDFNTTRDLNLGGGKMPSYLAFFPGLGAFANQPYQMYQQINTTVKSFSNELRFERTGNHFWIYRFGLFLNDSKSPFSGLIDYTGANGACLAGRGPLGALSPAIPCFPLGGGTAPKSHQRGYFTTQTLNFTGKDTLDVGVRYSKAWTDNPPNNTSSDAWTYNASYKHTFSDAAIVYGSYGRSFRPGGFDATGAATGAGAGGIPASFFTWGSEKSDSFELGVKGDLFNHRLIYALSGFYQKFNGFISRVNNVACNSNPQAGTSNVGCAGTGNVNLTYQGDASVRGVEMDLRGRITRDWDAQVLVSYADAHYDHAAIPCNDYNFDGIPNSDGTPGVQPGKYVSTCISNGSLSSQPKFQATFNTEYRIALPDDFNMFVRGLGRYRDSATNPNTGVRTPSSFKMDVFAGVKTPIGAEFSFFVRNLFDQRHDVIQPGQLYDLLGTPSNYTTISYDQPREFGLQLRMDL